MKWFGRSSGYYLFWSGFVYFVVGVTCAVWFKEIPLHFVTICWLTVLMLPLVVRPVGRYFNMGPLFGNKEKEMSESTTNDNNVVKFPEAKPDLKLVEPPKDTLDVSRPPYTIGVNDAGNVQFSMKTDYGTTTLTMTDEGVVGLIEDLAHYIRKTHTITIEEK